MNTDLVLELENLGYTIENTSYGGVNIFFRPWGRNVASQSLQDDKFTLLDLLADVLKRGRVLKSILKPRGYDFVYYGRGMFSLDKHQIYSYGRDWENIFHILTKLNVITDQYRFDVSGATESGVEVSLTVKLTDAFINYLDEITRNRLYSMECIPSYCIFEGCKYGTMMIFPGKQEEVKDGDTTRTLVKDTDGFILPKNNSNDIINEISKLVDENGGYIINELDYFDIKQTMFYK